MPRAQSNKLYRTFVKGLITEAGYLTYPQDASSDELNTVISRKGNRTRRLGLDYEAGATLTEHFPTGVEATAEYVWKSANNKPENTFLVAQTGSNLFFWKLSQTGSVSSGYHVSSSITLSDYIRPGASFSDVYGTSCNMIAGKGYLFVAHPAVEPLVITYNETLDTFTAEVIIIKIRDFDGLPDGLENDTEPSTLTDPHKYNLQNQGWLSLSQNPINAYHTKVGRWPGNNKQWWVARATTDDSAAIPPVAAGDFLPATLEKLFSGSSRAPRGHYILNAFRKDRTTVSGIAGFTVEDQNTRPTAVSFFSGRVWWTANSSVYYSQILSGKEKAGLCYQEADPTAEDISDLIASDGGVLHLPEADNIVALTPQANGLLVFSNNGVWFISGGSSQGFSARDVEVSKVSPIGTQSPLSIVALDNGVYWWSEIGIQALEQAVGQFGPVAGKFGNTNIAEQTVQTLYNNIPDISRQYVKGCFDPRNNTIQWLYDSTGTFGKFRYDSCLNYDLTLQAFYPWRISSAAGTFPKLTGIFLNVGNAVRYSKGVPPTQLTYLVSVGTAMTIAQFKSVAYVDFKTYDSSGLPYDSYVETGYELLEDAMRRKQILYIVTHCRRVDDDFVGSPVGTCTLQIKWDWTAKQYSNKWSGQYECYVPRIFNLGTTADVSAASMPIIVRKNKVRGSGKSIQFRFGTSERGRNFDLLGWEAAFVGNTQP